MVGNSEKIYEFENFSLNVTEQILLREGKSVALTPKVFDLLVLLVENHGHLMEKSVLLSKLWQDSFVEEANLNVNISALRRALGEKPNEHRFIETVPRRGYRFVAGVREIKADDVSLGSQIKLCPKCQKVYTDKTLNFCRIDGESLVLDSLSQNLTTAILPNRYELEIDSFANNQLKSKQESTFSHTTLQHPRKISASFNETDSLAVLPFVNESDDSGMDFFSDGITESIINALSKLSGLRVVARNTMFRFKGKDVDLRDVSFQVNARAVLTGRVHHLGDRLIIGAELVDAENYTQIWGERYSRTPSDIFEIQEEIAKEISEKLKLQLSREDQQNLIKRYTESADAYELYLKGHYHWNKFTEEGFRKGIDYFEQSLAIDPNFALAYSGLADVYVALYYFNFLPPNLSAPLSKKYALKALEIDEQLAQAHVSLAVTQFYYDWNWADAEKELKRAIELSPNHANTHHFYSHCLVTSGRGDEAIAEAKLARKLDPLSPLMNAGVGFAFYNSHKYDEAINQFQSTLELDPNFPLTHEGLGWAYYQKGMYDEALPEFIKSLPWWGGCVELIPILEDAYRKDGMNGFWRKWVECHQDQLVDNNFTLFVSASAYSILEEKDKAFECLEKVYQNRASYMVYLKVDPAFNNICTDPRFKDLLKRIGIEPDSAINNDEKLLQSEMLSIAPTESLSVTDNENNTNHSNRTLFSKFKLWMLLCGTVLILLVAFFSWRFNRESGKQSNVAQIRTIAVLPFKPLVNNKSDGALEMGMADALITKLSSLQQITVRPTSSITKYVEANADPLTAGRELQVEAVLEGKVQRADNKIRVTVQLLRVNDGATLWAESFDDFFTNIFAVQDSISEKMTSSLALKLSGKETELLAKRDTENTEAYTLYLQARYFHEKLDKENTLKSLEFYQAAIDKDPNYARAYSSRSGAFGYLATLNINREENQQQARDSVMKALSLDPYLGDAYASLGDIQTAIDWNFTEAEKNYRKAIELSPNEADIHLEYATFLSSFGRHDEAVKEIEKAVQLNPVAPYILSFYLHTLLFARRYDEAIIQGKKALELMPDERMITGALINAYIYKSMFAEAEALLSKFLEQNPSIDNFMKATIYLNTGKRAEGEKILRERIEKYKEGDNCFQNAIFSAALGDKEKAFKFLEKAVQRRESAVTLIAVIPEFDDLHSDTRFQDLLRRIGLSK